MGKELMLLLFVAVTLIRVEETAAKVQCKYPEILVTLGPRENHTVSICPPSVSSWDIDPGRDPMKQNVFKCDALKCNRCRCDVKMGYKLSNDTDQAECVMFCPRVIGFYVMLFVYTVAVQGRGSCKISEKLVTLKRGSVHEVPICNPIIRYANGETVEEPSPVQFDRFACTKAPVCRVCRCDRARGYKMASAERDAPCVMYCPVTKMYPRRCVRIDTATVCVD